jgi:hypothetical protein
VIWNVPLATIGYESRRPDRQYPSSSVLINTPGVASAVVNRNDAVWKGSLPATETVTSSSL